MIGFRVDHLASIVASTGVVVKFAMKGRSLSLSELNDAYLEWVKEMHKFDEDFIFVDEPFYIFSHPNALKELGVANKQGVIHSAQTLILPLDHCSEELGNRESTSLTANHPSVWTTGCLRSRFILMVLP